MAEEGSIHKVSQFKKLCYSSKTGGLKHRGRKGFRGAGGGMVWFLLLKGVERGFNEMTI